MAILREMIAQEVISGFKGKIDFYFWKGIPCARRWPSSPGKRRAPLVQAQWPIFTAGAKAWADVPADIRRLYEEMATDTGLSARDMYTRLYLAGFETSKTPVGDYR